MEENMSDEKNLHQGSSLDEFLEQENLLEEVESRVTVRNKEHDMSNREKKMQEDKISFNDWFVITMKSNKRIEAHHYDSILAYAKKQNLTESEPSSKYDEALKKFGF
jgi:hypothetical protein